MADEMGRMPSIAAPRSRTLEDDLKDTVRDLKRVPPMTPPGKAPEDFAPPNIRELRDTKKSPTPDDKNYTTLQAIAFSITRLTWKQAETMGAAIQAKMKDGVGTGSLTAAIQAWAEDWENFNI